MESCILVQNSKCFSQRESLVAIPSAPVRSEPSSTLAPCTLNLASRCFWGWPAFVAAMGDMSMQLDQTWLRRFTCTSEFSTYHTCHFRSALVKRNKQLHSSCIPPHSALSGSSACKPRRFTKRLQPLSEPNPTVNSVQHTAKLSRQSPPWVSPSSPELACPKLLSGASVWNCMALPSAAGNRRSSQ